MALRLNFLNSMAIKMGVKKKEQMDHTMQFRVTKELALEYRELNKCIKDLDLDYNSAETIRGFFRRSLLPEMRRIVQYFDSEDVELSSTTETTKKVATQVKSVG